MEIKLDNRSALAKLIESMNDMDVRQMLAYAVGYEAGKASQPIVPTVEKSCTPPMQEAI